VLDCIYRAVAWQRVDQTINPLVAELEDVMPLDLGFSSGSFLQPSSAIFILILFPVYRPSSEFLHVKINYNLKFLTQIFTLLQLVSIY
jgi:hypothetical protein